MPQVLVLGVVRLTRDLERDVVRLGVRDLVVAALELPCTPRRDDVHLGRERLDRQLETHLIVALAGAAVADRVGALGLGDLDDALGDRGTREGRAEQVFFIFGACLQARPDVVLDERLVQILDVQLGRAGRQRLFLQTVQLGALADVAGNGDHLAAVVFLQPRNDDGCIQTAGIGENDFFVLFHNDDLLASIFHNYTFTYFVCQEKMASFENLYKNIEKTKGKSALLVQNAYGFMDFGYEYICVKK